MAVRFCGRCAGSGALMTPSQAPVVCPSCAGSGTLQGPKCPPIPREPRSRPIPMNEWSVGRMLAGAKTETRRPIKSKRGEFPASDWTFEGLDDLGNARFRTACGWILTCRNPYGVPGDELWVRETWRVGAWATNTGRWVAESDRSGTWNLDGGQIAVDYKADRHHRTEWLDVPDSEMFGRFVGQSMAEAIRAGAELSSDRYGSYVWEPGAAPTRWRSPRFMPKLAARLILTILEIRVEPLHRITDAGANAEGVSRDYDYPVEGLDCPACGGDGLHESLGANYGVVEVDCRSCDTPRGRFENVWDGIYTPRGFRWEGNPWVWVVQFAARLVSPACAGKGVAL